MTVCCYGLIGVMRYFIYLSYLGKAYSGWQIQPEVPSVQETLQRVLTMLFGHPCSVVGSSRTDRGVHAREQVAHIDLPYAIDIAQTIYKLNKILPSDIGISAIKPVLEHAHARFHASYRSYEYNITTKKDPLLLHNSVWLYDIAPLESLNHIASIFCRAADFSYFGKRDPQRQTTTCHVQYALWSQSGDQIIFRIKADRFLRGMVRVIVSAILRASMGKIGMGTLQQWFDPASCQRPVLTLAPAHGLTLVEVHYPQHLFI